jgi:hypothetical protein
MGWIVTVNWTHPDNGAQNQGVACAPEIGAPAAAKAVSAGKETVNLERRTR